MGRKVNKKAVILLMYISLFTRVNSNSESTLGSVECNIDPVRYANMCFCTIAVST